MRQMRPKKNIIDKKKCYVNRNVDIYTQTPQGGTKGLEKQMAARPQTARKTGPKILW